MEKALRWLLYIFFINLTLSIIAYFILPQTITFQDPSNPTVLYHYPSWVVFLVPCIVYALLLIVRTTFRNQKTTAGHSHLSSWFVDVIVLIAQSLEALVIIFGVMYQPAFRVLIPLSGFTLVVIISLIFLIALFGLYIFYCSLLALPDTNRNDLKGVVA